MLPRRHYREVARKLAESTEPAAQAGVRAINSLLEERARLLNRIIRAEGLKPSTAEEPEPPKKSRLAALFS